MTDILTELHGRKIGLDKDGNLLVAGSLVTNYLTNPSNIGANSLLASGSTLALTSAQAGRRIALDTLTGSVVTLPAATGSQAAFSFVVTVIPTSNSHKIQVANASDFIIGVIQGVSDDPATMKGWIAANSGTVGTNSDTITLNRSTTGGVSKGEMITLRDIAANTWLVEGVITQTGTEATPFSAAV